MLDPQLETKERLTMMLPLDFQGSASGRTRVDVSPTQSRNSPSTVIKKHVFFLTGTQQTTGTRTSSSAASGRPGWKRSRCRRRFRADATSEPTACTPNIHDWFGLRRILSGSSPRGPERVDRPVHTSTSPLGRPHSAFCCCECVRTSWSSSIYVHSGLLPPISGAEVLFLLSEPSDGRNG